MIGDHLSDEVLSVYLDSDADGARGESPEMVAEPESHLSGCPDCRRRLSVLGAARQLVRTPPTAPSSEGRAAAVAAVMRRARESSVAPDVIPPLGAAHPNGTLHRPGPAVAPAWYRRPGLLVGVAAAAVALAIALPVALASKSAPSSSSALHATAGSSPKSDKRLSAPKTFGSSNAPEAPQAPGSSAGSAAVAPPSVTPALVNLGAVNSPQQLEAAMVSDLSASSPVAPGESSPSGVPKHELASGNCVQATRNASHGGAYGPAEVATAVYRGTPALVMEFWPTPTAPTAGQGVIAVASQSGCALLATTPT